MSRSTTVTVGAQAKSAWIPLNRYNPRKLFAVHLAAASNLTYSVEFTADDVQANGFVPADANVFTHADLSSKTANAFLAGPYLFSAVRLNVTAYTAGNATLTVTEG